MPLFATLPILDIEAGYRQPDNHVDESLCSSDGFRNYFCVAEPALMHNLVTHFVDLFRRGDQRLRSLALLGMREINRHEQPVDLAAQSIRPKQELIEDGGVELCLPRPFVPYGVVGGDLGCRLASDDCRRWFVTQVKAGQLVPLGLQFFKIGPLVVRFLPFRAVRFA